jgi:hypothetical protein
MSQLKYKETHHLRQWDLMLVIGILILIGVVALTQIVMSANPNENVLLITALSILILSGLFYYFHSIRLITRYNQKNIKLQMLPVGTVKRKIKWEDVVQSEIVELPKQSKFDAWNSLFTSLTDVTTRSGRTCLHLKLKNNEEINIGCADRKQLEAFVNQIL